jgi:hypothetical protein
MLGKDSNAARIMTTTALVPVRANHNTNHEACVIGESKNVAS